MALRPLIVVSAFTWMGVKADDGLSDFSNNLASDIAPLLVLFGDSMTKQYLSESTTPVDYFIFAMAPIGILTTMISTIRVCGHLPLRAFVGKSQEGEGVVEADLCTSTNADVCELFNRGGIARVLGSPSILEVVLVRKHGQNSDERVTELNLSQHYFSTHVPAVSDWERVQGSSSGPFAPNPNLSLNIGIKKQPDWVFWTIASVGFVLQGGILALAAVGVWVLHWEVSNSATTSSRTYAPIMFITGSILMCSGMWGCAALIGQTTRETRFERNKPSSTAQCSQLIWLQPGPQVIGDQIFYPFAHLETPENPIRIWTSSIKISDRRFETYTYFAVLAVLIGYIMQFIGLRGLKAWVALAQLGATVVMSILRGVLRMKRLQRDDNRLVKISQVVEGHELDWLAFEVSKRVAKDELFGHVLGVAEQDTASYSQGSDTADFPRKDHSFHVPGKILSQSEEEKLLLSSSPVKAEEHHYPLSFLEVLLIRQRLADLTGHLSLGLSSDSNHQDWKVERVNVRAKALRLSSCMGQISENLFRKNPPKSKPTLRLKTALRIQHSVGINDYKESIHIDLEKLSQFTQNNWRVDSARVEAVLGLWVWSMISDTRIQRTGHSSAVVPETRSELARIVSSRARDPGKGGVAFGEGEMNLWFGFDGVQFKNTTLILSKGERGGLLGPRESSSFEDGWEPRERWQPTVRRRFLGWNVVHRLSEENGGLDSEIAAKETAELRVQVIPVTALSLVDMCAQELFVNLALALTAHVPIAKADVTESGGTIQLEHPVVTELVNAFVENGLGSHADGLLCVVPALWHQLCPSDNAMLSSMSERADSYRRQEQWSRAEVMLRDACKRYSPRHQKEEATQDGRGPGWQSTQMSQEPFSTTTNLFGSALRATAELYRWSLSKSSAERISFGSSGIQWLCEHYAEIARGHNGVREILMCYEEIRRRICDDSSRRDTLQDAASTHKLLVEALRGRSRMETLFQLCFVAIGDFGSRILQPVLPLAVSNQWREVVGVLLEMKAGLDGQDGEGRTALSYYSEQGDLAGLETMISLGAFLDRPDGMMRTPIHWAAIRGHTGTIEVILHDGRADINRRDKDGRTPLSCACEGGIDASVIRRLIEAGADIEAKDDSHRTPLSWASKMGHMSVVRELIDHKADIDSTSGWPLKEQDGVDENGELVPVFTPDLGWTPLAAAAARGHLDIVRLLAERGARLDVVTSAHGRPVKLACRNGHEAVALYLVEKGWRSTPEEMIWAAEGGCLAVARLLLERGADVNAAAPPHEPMAPLTVAAYFDREHVVRFLLENEAYTEARSWNERTPLHLAARMGRAAVARLLVENGAKVDATDDTGETPLSYSADGGFQDIVRMLLGAGAKIDTRDCKGRSALWKAAEKGHNVVAQLLLDAGADANMQDDWGISPVSIATKKGHNVIAELLGEKLGSGRVLTIGTGRSAA